MNKPSQAHTSRARFDGRWLRSWVRHSFPDEPALSYGSVLLIDGAVSYVCQAVERAAPEGQWRLGFQRPKSYELRNHPVLGRGDAEFDVAHDRLVRDLRAVQGIEEIHREDREVLLVRAPAWDAGRLADWVTSHLEQRLHR